MTSGSMMRNERHPPLIRVRLIYQSDCVQAQNLGMILTALGENDGPPFIIRDIIKGQLITITPLPYSTLSCNVRS